MLSPEQYGIDADSVARGIETDQEWYRDALIFISNAKQKSSVGINNRRTNIIEGLLNHCADLPEHDKLHQLLHRAWEVTLWPHALMLLAHGAHPDDAAQQAVHHQIQQDDLQQTQLAIEETLAAQIRQAKQEALELELQDKIRDTNKKLVTDALDQGLEPNRARTLGGGVAMSPAKKRRGEQLQDASGAMVTSNGRGGTYQIGGAGSSNASAPTAEGTAPLPDATPATAPGAASSESK
jgi:hypothetical protein